MANRILDIARDDAGAPLTTGNAVLKRESDNATIDGSKAIGADGSFAWTEEEAQYPGLLRYEVTSGATTRKHSGRSIGQVGTWFISDFVRVMRLMSDGVLAGVDGQLAVTAAGSDMNVSVASGCAILYGHPSYWAAARNVLIGANGSGNPRIDLIVIRLYPPDAPISGANSPGKQEIVALVGTPAAVPASPTPTTNPATVWEIPLAEVRVEPGVSSIAPSKVTDRRSYTAGPSSAFLGATTIRVTNAAALTVEDVSGSDKLVVDTTAGEVELRNATDLRVFSDNGTTEKASIDGTTGNIQTDGNLTVNGQAFVTSSVNGALVVEQADSTDVIRVDAAPGNLQLVIANGADLAFYADSGSNEKARIEGTAGTAQFDGLMTLDGGLNVTAGTITLKNVSDAELAFLANVTSDIQTQLNAKYAPGGSDVAVADGGTGASTASVARTNLGLVIGTDVAPVASPTFTGTVTADALTATGPTTLGNGNNDLTKVTGRLEVAGGTFTVTLGPQAGSGGSAGASRLRGFDSAGEIQVITGTAGVAAGIMATVNFAQARPDTDYLVFFQPSSQNAADLNLSLTSRTTGGFDVRANTAPGTGETLQIQFFVVEV